MPPEPFELRIRPSGPRRVAGVGMLLVLGVMLVLLGLLRPPPSVGLRFFVLAAGAASLVLGRRMWVASASGLVLDAEGLREAGPEGRRLAGIDGVRRVERGPFAFKPSNGFLLTTNEPGPRAWRPGVWWRLGRRVGVGGVLRGAEARAAAEAMEVAVLSRPPSRGADRSGGG